MTAGCCPLNYHGCQRRFLHAWLSVCLTCLQSSSHWYPPDFSFEKIVKWMLGPFEQSVTLWVAYHVTKSNVIIGRKFFHKWMVMSGKEGPAFDLSWQLADHCTCDSCPVICSSASSKLIYQYKWMSCGMSEDGGGFTQFYKECAFTWNNKHTPVKYLYYTKTPLTQTRLIQTPPISNKIQ